MCPLETKRGTRVRVLTGKRKGQEAVITDIDTGGLPPIFIVEFVHGKAQRMYAPDELEVYDKELQAD